MAQYKKRSTIKVFSITLSDRQHLERNPLSFFKGREDWVGGGGGSGGIVSQTKIGTVSKATLGKLPRDVVERIWAFPSA